MILDKEALFADNLDVGGTPTNLDTGIVSPGKGKCLKIFATADSAVTGITGMSLQDSADGTNFSALFTWTGDIAGDQVELEVPSDAERYLKLNLAGTVAGGNWTAGIILPGAQSAV
jgi:hypothetical protein